MPVKVLGKTGYFNYNWGMVQDPKLTSDTMTFSFLSQFDTPGNVNSEVAYPKKYHFADRDDYLQVLLTDRVINTFLESAEEQDLLTFSTLDTHEVVFRKFLTGRYDMDVNSEDFEDILPELAETYPRTNMKVDI